MPAHSAQEVDSARGHAAILRDAYRRALGLSPDERRRVLRTVLRYRLKDLAPNAADMVLRQLRAEFVDAPAATAETERAPAAPTGDVPADLRDLLKMIMGNGGDSDSPGALRDARTQIQDSIHALRTALRKPNFSLVELLQRAARDLGAHDTALENAARESFDRLLSALDPAEAMKVVPKKTLSTEATYKAALFDAIKEKHQQLQLYHGKGRLVRDYKSAYKKYVQEETSR